MAMGRAIRAARMSEVLPLAQSGHLVAEAPLLLMIGAHFGFFGRLEFHDS